MLSWKNILIPKIEINPRLVPPRKDFPMIILHMLLVLYSIYIGPGYYKQRGLFNIISKKEEGEDKVANENDQEQGIYTFLKPAPVGFNARVERFKGNMPKQGGPGRYNWICRSWRV